MPELAEQDEAAGLGDAPWPAHFRKMEGEATQVAPLRAKSEVKKPLIVVANSPDKRSALAGLEKWKVKHAEVAGFLVIDEHSRRLHARQMIDVDIRVNLHYLQQSLRPVQETPDPDDDPTRDWRARRRQRAGQ